jgi:hypothetical protein
VVPERKRIRTAHSELQLGTVVGRAITVGVLLRRCLEDILRQSFGDSGAENAKGKRFGASRLRQSLNVPILLRQSKLYSTIHAVYLSTVGRP